MTGFPFSVCEDSCAPSLLLERRGNIAVQIWGRSTPGRDDPPVGGRGRVGVVPKSGTGRTAAPPAGPIGEHPESHLGFR